MPPLTAAVCIVLCEALSFGFILPVMPYFNEALHGTPAFLGLLFALISGPKIITNPFFGWLSDRVGRRPVLIVNTLGTIGGSLLWVASHSTAVLALSRAVTGVFSAQAGIAQAIAADTSTPARRARSMAMLGASFAIALTLGPVAGAWVGKQFGYAAVGWLCAALQTASLGVIVFGLRETRVRTEKGKGGPDAAPLAVAEGDGGAKAQIGAAAALRMDSTVRHNGQLWLLLGIVAVVNAGTNGVFSTLPLLVERRFHFDVYQAGLVLAVMGIVAALMQGGAIRPLVARFGERAATLGGCIVMMAGFAVLSAGTQLTPFWAGLVASSVGVALVSPCLSAMLSQAVSAEAQGAAGGLQQAALAIGRTIGNFAGGASFQVLSPAAPALLATAWCAAAFGLLLRTRGRQAG